MRASQSGAILPSVGSGNRIIFGESIKRSTDESLLLDGIRRLESELKELGEEPDCSIVRFDKDVNLTNDEIKDRKEQKQKQKKQLEIYGDPDAEHGIGALSPPPPWPFTPFISHGPNVFVGGQFPPRQTKALTLWAGFACL